ncbi:MAG: hypothetical protein IPI67_31215 [Myxococcales bacterium]|nr:hypothetical protein [Myxococcales bacterium]
MESAPQPPSVPSTAPSATAAATPSASAAPEPIPGALPNFIIGRFKGSASVYATVVDEHQTYTKREIELEIDATGATKTKLTRGSLKGQQFTPSYRCEASGKLRPSAGGFELELEVSTCAAAPAGAKGTFRIVRVGDCQLQYDRQSGKSPFEVEQIAVRREGCK